MAFAVRERIRNKIVFTNSPLTQFINPFGQVREALIPPVGLAVHKKKVFLYALLKFFKKE